MRHTMNRLVIHGNLIAVPAVVYGSRWKSGSTADQDFALEVISH